MNAKVFSRSRIVSSKDVKKDGLWKYIQTAQQKKPQNFKKKIDMGATPYLQSVVEEVPIGTRFEDLKDFKNGQ